MAKEKSRAETAAMRVSGPNDPLMQVGAVKAKKGKGILKIALLSSLLLVLTLGFSALGWWLRGPLSASQAPPAEAAADSGEQTTGSAEAATGSAEAATEADADPATASNSARQAVQGLLPLEPFTVNLADRETPRYLRLSVKLGVDSAKAVESINKDAVLSAQVRDAVMGLVVSLTSQQVLSAEGKAKLRKDISDLVNGIITQGKVLEVYFLELVVQ